MTAQASPPKKRGYRPFSSIGAKITLILLAMGAASAVVGVLVSTVFSRVSEDMSMLTRDMLPQLEYSAVLTDAAGLTRDSMTDILLAGDSAGLKQGRIKAEEAASRLQEGVKNLPEALQPKFATLAENADQSLKELLAARESVFVSDAQISAQITAMQTHSRSLQHHLLEAADEAYFNLTLGGEDTIASIETTLTGLVNEQFSTLQSLLEAQADINLLAGMSLGLGQIRDVPTKKIMTQAATGSAERLTVFLEDPAALGLNPEEAETVQNAFKVFERMLVARRSEQKALRKEVLSAREASANALIVAIDNTIFELTMAAEESSTTNRDAVQSLLDNEVGVLNQLLEMNTLINSLQVAALRVVSSDGVEQVQIAADPLTTAAKALGEFVNFQNGVLTEDIHGIAAQADASGGLAASRIATIQAQAKTIEVSQAAAQAVSEIAHHSATLSGESQTAISEMAVTVTNDVREAEQQMYGLLGVSAAVLVLSLLLTKLLITRPLAKISETTEHLAAGDLSPVTGYDRASTEVYRIAQALSVFRNGLVEKEEMSKAVEAEREARQAEQTAAVTAIGDGLERLSKGDLTVRIQDDMSDGYAKLRDDFNQTLESLKTTVFEVVGSSESIRNGATEISQASDDLSRRTESQAATLEQTAAALEEMTSSVKSAAEGALSVESIVNEAKQEAEESGVVVQSAVSAMTEIESSARHISQIIGVIDDISFQTNLLALNAGVEAARAGEAGRGFAVVASEVRILAQRSSDAATEIKSLITDSSKHVDRGVLLVGKAGEALNTIVDRVGNISHLVSEMAVGSADQSTGLAEINIGVSQLDNVTQQNAAMVEEATAASHLLNSDARKLSTLVSHFKIDDTGHSQENPFTSHGETDISFSPQAEQDDDWSMDEAPLQPAKVASAAGNMWEDF
ncbi:methyl-accepting chemotaxis protein [Parasedimentitalea marina]|nr:methyl-accepting chemotaxis protein [Parasedimentitalea marina]